jgi:hypothetical protein
MDRVDLYSVIHKGLRAALFDGALAVQRTDFGRDAACAATIERVRHLLGLLDEHAGHEDASILPVLRCDAPVVCEELEAEHARLGGLQLDVARLLERVAGATGAERLSLGRRLHERMGGLVAAHLVHMEREEVAGNRALWAHRSDAELLDIHRRIVGSIPGPRMREWAVFLLPALPEPERDRLLEGIKAMLTPADFEPIAALLATVAA